ncbi:MAG: hypothetical protein KF768_10790 [Phycisphaeraceae bacterium]|nr:hypothetical protein [Phycisphaeraceae bacterium]
MTRRSTGRGNVLFAAALAAIVGGGLVFASPAAMAQPEVRNEGMGTPRRAQQDAMVLKPFPAEAWSHVEQWTNGSAPTPEQLAGKAVLIVTWAGWHRAGDTAVRLAQSMHEQNHEKGLVVLGVHNERGFDKAAEAAQRLGVKFPYARDIDGKFKGALLLDQDPDFAVIDRAGNVRFLDIETSSVAAAVSIVVGETLEQAQGKPGAVAAASEQARRDALRTRDIGATLAPGQTISVQFELPEQEVYDRVNWPHRVKGEGRLEFDKLSDQLIHEPPRLKRPEEEGYFPTLPNAHGKLVVMYFIDPKIRGLLNILPTMNNVQDVFARDATVIGVAAKFGVESFGLSSEDAGKLAQRNEPLVREIYRTRPMNHSTIVNVHGLTLERMNNIQLFGRSMEDAATCLIMSTDGTIRWIGHPGEEGFRVMMNRLIAADPGVKSRRAAEDAALKLRQR